MTRRNIIVTISRPSTHIHAPRSKVGLMPSESSVGSTRRRWGVPPLSVITRGDTFRDPSTRNVRWRTTVWPCLEGQWHCTYTRTCARCPHRRKYAVIMGATGGERPKSGHSELRQGSVHPCNDDGRGFHVGWSSEYVRATSSRTSFAGYEYPTKRRSVGVRTGPHNSVLSRWRENQVRKVPMKKKAKN